MKKLLTLLFVLPFILGSCSKDDDEILNTLNKTVWETSLQEENTDIKLTMYFYESTFSVKGYKLVNGENEDISISGTYKYDHPNIVMTIDREEQVATISGNKLSISGGDLVYTKK